jgi:hypothetical protein
MFRRKSGEANGTQFSCRIEKVDDAIWMKHLPLDLREYCQQFRPGREFPLLINGHEVLFTWMRHGADNRPTPGIKAAASGRGAWNRIPRKSVIRIGIPK